jgi:hypothetical protein
MDGHQTTTIFHSYGEQEMVKKKFTWFLPVLAIALVCMGQAFAQDTELTSIKVADDKAADKDACDKGCSFEWGEDTWLTVGAGLRTSFRKQAAITNGDRGAYDNNFNIDNARVYLNGRGHDCIGFEFNLDIDNAQGFNSTIVGNGPDNLDDASVRLLDAIVKFEFNDLLNIWMGRMIVPSDRANLSGPFYMNAGWDFPFTQFGYNEIFQGRDDGATVWGQLGGGAVKYQVGAFEGTNNSVLETQGNGANNPDDLMVAGRFTVNLLDPEAGYYNSSTYHGEKDILAIGYAFNHQNNSVGINGAYSAYNFDVMYETTLGNGGVATLAGAYYDTSGSDNAANNGRSYFAEASYLTAREFALGCCVSGKVAPFWRHQEFRRDNGEIDRQTDYGFHYVMYGHNARMTYAYSQLRGDNVSTPDESDQHIIGLQLQY